MRFEFKRTADVIEKHTRETDGGVRGDFFASIADTTDDCTVITVQNPGMSLYDLNENNNDRCVVNIPLLVTAGNLTVFCHRTPRLGIRNFSTRPPRVIPALRKSSSCALTRADTLFSRDVNNLVYSGPMRRRRRMLRGTFWTRFARSLGNIRSPADIFWARAQRNGERDTHCA